MRKLLPLLLAISIVAFHLSATKSAATGGATITAAGPKVEAVPILESDTLYRVLENTQIAFTVTGCTGQSVDFAWFEPRLYKWSDKSQQIGTPGRKDDKKDVPINADGQAILYKGGDDPTTDNGDQDFDDEAFTWKNSPFNEEYEEGSNSKFLVSATCEDGNTTALLLEVASVHEHISIQPENAIADTLFFAIVRQVKPNTCYYIRIQDTQTGEYIDKPPIDQPELPEGYADDPEHVPVNSCAGGNDPNQTELILRPSILAASDRWGDYIEAPPIEIPKLYEGDFKIILYKQENFADNALAHESNTDPNDFPHHDFTVGQNTGIPKNLPCARNAIDQNKGTCTRFPTAFGQIFTEPGEFVGRVMTVFLGIGGAIALILIIRASYVLMISRGDPEKVEEGKEILTAAIVGLLFIIFAFVILEVITVDILKIPGFER